MFFNKSGISISTEPQYKQIMHHKTVIESPCSITGIVRFQVGFIGAYTFFRGGDAQALKAIGRFCSVAPGVAIGPVEHDIRLLTTSTFLNNATGWEDAEGYLDYWEKNKIERANILQQIRSSTFVNQRSVTIGNDVWIGQNVIIRRGVTIGDGAVIGANSVVISDVKPYEVVAGAPAKHLKYRFPLHLVVMLQRLSWWELSLKSLDGVTWSDPEKACEQLTLIRESGNYEVAKYRTIQDLL